jgi:hypothetical protein
MAVLLKVTLTTPDISDNGCCLDKLHGRYGIAQYVRWRLGG